MSNRRKSKPRLNPGCSGKFAEAGAGAPVFKEEPEFAGAGAPAFKDEPGFAEPGPRSPKKSRGLPGPRPSKNSRVLPGPGPRSITRVEIGGIQSGGECPGGFGPRTVSGDPLCPPLPPFLLFKSISIFCLPPWPVAMWVRRTIS